MNRKRFSERRASMLYDVVHKRLIDLRIAALKGTFNNISAINIEAKLYEMLVKKDLAAEVVAEYMRSYAKTKP